MAALLVEILSLGGYLPVALHPGDLPPAADLRSMVALITDFTPDRQQREETRLFINEVRRRAAPCRLPVVGLTADFQLLRRASSRFEDLQDFAILPKPFGVDELLDVLVMMLARTGRRPADAMAGSTGILYTDLAGRYTDASPAALSMLGYSLEELRGLRVADVMDATDRATLNEWTRYRRERTWAADAITLRRKDGRPLIARVHASIINGNGGEDATHVAWIRPQPPMPDAPSNEAAS